MVVDVVVGGGVGASGEGVVGAPVVGASVVRASVVGASVVGAPVFGASVVGASVVGAWTQLRMPRPIYECPIVFWVQQQRVFCTGSMTFVRPEGQ
jgi:hypothetical protein